MRILCIIDCLGSGGAQRQMTYLACGLKRRGHDVHVFLTHPGADHFRPELESAGIAIHGIARHGGRGFSVRVLMAVRRLLASGFDGIIAFQLSAGGYAVLAPRLAPGRAPAVIFGERTYTKAMRPWRRIGVACVGWLADAIVANSFCTASYLRRWPGLARKLTVVWNGYPSDAQHVDAGDLQGAGPLNLLMIGRYASEKNGLRLLQALHLVQERYGWTPCLRWVGSRQCNAESVRMRNAMEAFLAENPALAARCSLLDEDTDVARHYRSCDAVILPSLFEGMPNAVCEAMMLGTPVLASRVCDNPLLLGDEERGILFDPLDPGSIADAIVRFREMSPSRKADMAARARRFAEERLSLSQMIDSYVELLDGARTVPGPKGS